MSILSVSRRTDIPSYYSEWFFNRLDAGEFYTRNNPYNQKAVARYTFNKSDIDCIVLWTKNPIPMMNSLDRLKDYKFYFQFTLTGYGRDMEANLPNKLQLIDTFKDLSMIAPVVWRYDPIMFTDKYTVEWHLKMFENLASRLYRHTDRCVISFVDIYKFVNNHLLTKQIYNENKEAEDLFNFSRKLSEIAHKYGMQIFSCGEKIDLMKAGIEHGSCIDKKFIENLAGYPLKASKDKGQRNACGCIESIDVGKYNTCRNSCYYCYACSNLNELESNLLNYDKDSPILCDTLNDDDIITEHKLQSLRTYEQFSFF